MSLFHFFDGPEKKTRLSHIKNLLALAMSDKSLDKNELELIFNIGAKAGLSRSELERILNNPESVSFYPPATGRERVDQLFDLTMLMIVDGEIDVREMLLCKAIAVKMGFKHEIIDLILDKMVELIAHNITREVAVLRMMQIFGDL
jgi:hypothetical protein